MPIPKKYAHINFTPPADVRAAARQGLKLHEDGKTGPGLEPITVAWARRIADGEDISPDKARQGNRFWGRNKRFLDFAKDSPAYAAAMLWFGKPGQRWMAKLADQMKAADMKNKSLATLANQIAIVRGLIESKPQNGEYYDISHPLPLTYKSGAHSGAMVALFLPSSVGAKFHLGNRSDAIPPGEMHVTLAYLGKADDLSPWQVEHLHEIIELIAENHPPLQGNINGCGRFCNEDPDGDPFIIIPDLPKLPTLREVMISLLDYRKINCAKDHGFTPHITLAYIPHTNPNPFDQVDLTPVTFPVISLVLGGDRYDYPFTMGLEGISKAALVEKIGARHTLSECELIQKIHDLVLNLGAECYPLTRRAGAKHSMADQRMIQRIHDDCRELGAACKALPERDELYYGQVMKEGETIKGSAGSGNFGHDGRPGKLGGSSRGGGLKRIGAKKDTPPGDRKKAAKEHREKKKGIKDKTKVRKISEGLTNRQKKALGSFKKESKLGVDLLDIPGVVKGTKITKVGAEAVNHLFNEGLIRQTSVIGPSGYPRMKATDLGKQVLSLKAALTTKAQTDAPNYAPASTPQRCELCAFFRGDEGEDYCTRFEFTADPDYVCDDWQTGTPDEIPGYVANKGDLARLTEGVLRLRGLVD